MAPLRFHDDFFSLTMEEAPIPWGPQTAQDREIDYATVVDDGPTIEEMWAKLDALRIRLDHLEAMTALWRQAEAQEQSAAQTEERSNGRTDTAG